MSAGTEQRKPAVITLTDLVAPTALEERLGRVVLRLDLVFHPAKAPWQCRSLCASLGIRFW